MRGGIRAGRSSDARKDEDDSVDWEQEDEDEEVEALLAPASSSSGGPAAGGTCRSSLATDGDLLPQLPWWREIADLAKLAFPIFVSRISGTLKAVTDTAILGHLDGDSRYLLASALSDMWMSSTGVAMNGMVLGIFCGQAFGAGNKQLAGIWLQVSLCVLFAVSVPVACLWLATGWVMGAVGQPAERASDAAYYAQVPYRAAKSDGLLL